MAVTRYVYGGNGDLLSEDRAGIVKYYRFDGRGSTTAMFNQFGAVSDTFRFDSFGNAVERTGTTATPFRWGVAGGFQTQTGSQNKYPSIGRGPWVSGRIEPFPIGPPRIPREVFGPRGSWRYDPSSGTWIGGGVISDPYEIAELIRELLSRFPWPWIVEERRKGVGRPPLAGQPGRRGRLGRGQPVALPPGTATEGQEGGELRGALVRRRMERCSLGLDLELEPKDVPEFAHCVLKCIKDRKKIRDCLKECGLGVAWDLAAEVLAEYMCCLIFSLHNKIPPDIGMNPCSGDRPNKACCDMVFCSCMISKSLDRWEYFADCIGGPGGPAVKCHAEAAREPNCAEGEGYLPSFDVGVG